MLRQQQLALANAWIDLWGAQEKSRLQRELTALYRNTYDSAQRRLKAGDIAASDVARIDLDLQRAETDRIAANTDLIRARFVLASLLVMEPQAPQLSVVSPWPASEPASTTIIAAGDLLLNISRHTPDLSHPGITALACPGECIFIEMDRVSAA
jgi:cobalt-zinc-cadmium efflux system outer membrane protein